MTKRRPDSLVRLAPLVFVFIWATGFIVARLVAPHSEPFTLVTTRLVITAIILSILAMASQARWPRTWSGWWNGLLAGVLLHGGYLGAVFWSIKHGLPAGIAALLSGMQPLVTGVLVGPLLGEEVSLRRWLGIGLGFAGALLVLAPRLAGIDALPSPALLVCFGGVVSITLGTIWQKRTAATVDLRTNAVVQYLGATALTLPLALTLEDLKLGPVPALWIGLLWSVFGLSIGAIGLLLMLIRRDAVAGVAALLYLVPPLSALMAYLLFGETLLPVQLAGIVLAVLGVGIASR